jgi:hypothetical protein
MTIVKYLYVRGERLFDPSSQLYDTLGDCVDACKVALKAYPGVYIVRKIEFTDAVRMESLTSIKIETLS